MKKTLKVILFTFAFLSVFSAFVLKNALAEEDLFEKLRIIEPKKENPAPPFTLKGLDGKNISLGDYKGKMVLLNFWATWCKPCREEMPAMQKLYDMFVDEGFVILAVSIDRGKVEAVKAFVDELKLTFPIALDPTQEVRNKYFVNALPTSYLIGPDGKMKGFITGSRDWASDDAVKLINTFLQESSSQNK